jgi:Transcriptional regulators
MWNWRGARAYRRRLALRRVRALEKAGLIKGYHAEVNAEALGFTVTIFAQVGLSSQAETDLKAFEALMASYPEVRECHMLRGRRISCSASSPPIGTPISASSPPS